MSALFICLVGVGRLMYVHFIFTCTNQLEYVNYGFLH